MRLRTAFVLLPALAGMLRAQAPLNPPVPLSVAAAATSPAENALELAAADRAEEMGFPTVAAGFYRNLLAASAGDRARLTLGLATALLDDGRPAEAEQALQALGVPAEHLAMLAEHAEIRALAAGETLCRSGDPADAVFVLMQGEADVVLPQSHGDRRVLLAHLSPGAVLGERALFEAGTRGADVTCPVASRVLILSGPALASLQQKAPATALALVLAITRSTSVSLQHANAAIERLEV